MNKQDMGKHLKSKTVKWNWLLGALQAANAQIFLFKDIMSPEMFAYVSMVLAVTHAAGGHYIRTITDQALSQKQ